jgi:hypothetical protein
MAAEHGLGPDDVVVSRQELEELQGQLYCLQAAVEDVDGDLAQASGPGEVREALDWLLQNTRPLAEAWLEPRMADLT